jgi:hypothetical protein
MPKHTNIVAGPGRTAVRVSSGGRQGVISQRADLIGDRSTADFEDWLHSRGIGYCETVEFKDWQCFFRDRGAVDLADWQYEGKYREWQRYLEWRAKVRIDREQTAPNRRIITARGA